MQAKLFFLLLLISLITTSDAQNNNGLQTLAPEVTKTVNALVGQWKFTGSDTKPGSTQPQKVTMEIGCKLVRLGSAIIHLTQSSAPPH
jgi:hypothetical protein